MSNGAHCTAGALACLAAHASSLVRQHCALAQWCKGTDHEVSYPIAPTCHVMTGCNTKQQTLSCTSAQN
eukprot:1157805-Pelagomonas_calceolata.AAC.16